MYTDLCYNKSPRFTGKTLVNVWCTFKFLKIVFILAKSADHLQWRIQKGFRGFAWTSPHPCFKYPMKNETKLFHFHGILRQIRENQQSEPPTPLYIWTRFPEILDPLQDPPQISSGSSQFAIWRTFKGFYSMLKVIFWFQDIFMFLIKQLRGLEDPNSPTFKRYFYLLEVSIAIV